MERVLEASDQPATTTTNYTQNSIKPNNRARRVLVCGVVGWCAPRTDHSHLAGKHHQCSVSQCIWLELSPQMRGERSYVRFRGKTQEKETNQIISIQGRRQWQGEKRKPRTRTGEEREGSTSCIPSASLDSARLVTSRDYFAVLRPRFFSFLQSPTIKESSSVGVDFLFDY